MRRTYFRLGPPPDRASVSHVTVISGQKAPLGRIWCNFRLRIRRTYFRTGHVTDVTSSHVTNGSTTAQHHRKYDVSVPIYYSEDRQDNGQKKKNKRSKGQTMIYRTLHRKLKIEQNEPHREQRVNSGAPERQAVSSPLVTPQSHRLKLYNIIHKLRASLYFC